MPQGFLDTEKCSCPSVSDPYITKFCPPNNQQDSNGSFSQITAISLYVDLENSESLDHGSSTCTSP